MPTPAELLRALSERGQPRGASQVFSEATARAGRPPAVLLAAAVVVVAVVAAGVGLVAQDQDASTVAAPGRAQIEDTDPAAPTATGAEPGGTTTPAETSTVPVEDDAASGPSSAPRATTQLEAHHSCGGVLERLRALGLEAVGPHGFDRAPSPTAAAPDAAEGAAPTADTTRSRSNVQEPGVDEGDLAKTDGTIAVAVARGRLQLVSVTDRSLLSSLELPARPTSLFLVDSTVVVLGEPVWGREHHDGAETPVVLVDVGDPTRPSVRQTTWVEGVVRTSRLQGGVVRLVTGDAPRFSWASPTDGSEAAAKQAEAENRGIVEQSSLGAWLPDYRTVDPQGRVLAAGSAADCRSTYTPSEHSGVETTTVVTIDPRTGVLDPGTSVAATPVVVYASEASLYVVSTTCCSESRRNASDVHRFDLSSPVAAPYRSSGSVRGLPVDQFALSERDGHLRIATTYLTGPTTRADDRAPSRDLDTDSAIWVLAESGSSLDPVGSVTGLGEDGERIFAVRYHEDHAYVVTFRRTDPLYVVELSDPRSPTLRGELHVPGFSTFLQHLGAGRLMGIGRDADDEGRSQGLQLSLFDVTDPQAPNRSDVLDYEHGDSSAEHDHLAFLHWAPTDLVVLPLFEASGTDPCGFFAGAVMIRVDGTSLAEVGRVSHAHHATTEEDSDAVVPIVRSMIADGSLLTVSELGMAFGDLGDGTEQHFVTFEGPGSDVEHVGCRSGHRDPGEEPTITIPM